MSFTVSGITNHTPAEVVAALQGQVFPDQLKEYILVGVAALRQRYGSDVKVAVTCYGHLHDGTEGNSTTTSATVEVRAVGGMTPSQP